MSRLADCFARRETLLTCRNMVQAMLMTDESANCWSLGEAIGHRGPYVLQHFLSRARWSDEGVRDRLASWVVDRLGEESVVLVVDETGDTKSSTDAVGAARQYSGALGAGRIVPGGGASVVRHRSRARADRSAAVLAQRLGRR
ncbi:transposase [Nonomuraea sp. JJY05]|uniref:transposase n=1 Tax=Nonomuraea sp. JJY05 TaxID=3350255 RepID=UPI00373E5FD3